MGLLLYPYFLVVFWYRDFFSGSVRVSAQILEYTASLLSVPLLLKTFFKPLKNEYREGLVLFSVLAGIFIKSLILLATLFILAIIALVLLLVNVVVLLLPAIIIGFIFLKKIPFS